MDPLEEVFDFNALPLEMLEEIFSHLSNSDRRKVALVCDKWFSFARSKRFNQDGKQIRTLANLTDFLRIFQTNTSMSLPMKTIHLQLERESLNRVPYHYHFSELRQIFHKYNHAKICLSTDVEINKFENLIESLPMVEEVKWQLCQYCFRTNGFNLFERCWSGICNAASKLKKVSLNLEDGCSLHSDTIGEDNDHQQRALDVMCRAPADKIIITSILMDLRQYGNLMDQRLIKLMKNVEAANLFVNLPIHFDFINMFGQEKLSNLHLSIINRDNNRTFIENMIDLLPKLRALKSLDILIDFESMHPFTFTSDVKCLFNLTKLVIKNVRLTLDCQSLKRFIRSCPNLKHIKISNSITSREEALDLQRAICKNCPALETFSTYLAEDFFAVQVDEIFTGIQPNEIIDYEQSIVNLQNLTSIVMVNHISDFLVFDGKQMNSLKELKIGFIFMSEFGIQKFVDACPNIEILYLFGDDDKLYVSIKCFEILSELKKLKKMCVRYCVPGEKERCTEILKRNKPNLTVTVYEGILLDSS